MDKGGTLDLTDTDFPSADQKEDGRKVGAATLVAAAIYGGAPLNVSFAKAAAIEAEAELIKQQDGMENFISASGNVAVKSRSEKEKEQDEKALELLSSILEELESEKQREREREEWSRTLHSFGRVEMTGAEWQSFSDALRGDTELRRWLVERAQRNGHTETEAEAIADEVADISNIMAIPESQRTPEQRQRLQTAQGNPELREYMEAAADRHRRERGASNERENSLRTGSTVASVRAGADELEAFSSAPNLKTHYVRAASVEIGDQPPPAPPAKSTPAPVISSGFEM